MVIGLISSTERWEKILDLDKFVLLCPHILDQIVTLLYSFHQNFRNTVNNEVEPDVG